MVIGRIGELEVGSGVEWSGMEQSGMEQNKIIVIRIKQKMRYHHRATVHVNKPWNKLLLQL